MFLLKKKKKVCFCLRVYSWILLVLKTQSDSLCLLIEIFNPFSLCSWLDFFLPFCYFLCVSCLFCFSHNPLLPSLRLMLSSVTQSCPTLWPHESQCARPPCHHQLPEFTQTHADRVSDAIQPSHPLSSPSPPAPNPSQHANLRLMLTLFHQNKFLHYSFISSPSLVVVFLHILHLYVINLISVLNCFL